MSDGTVKNRFVFICGLIGIIAAFVTTVSDAILLGRPVSAYAFFRFGTESLADMAQWRIVTGTFVGVFALPFQIAGIVPLYCGLRKAGGTLAVFVAGTAAYALIMGVAFHAAYAFIAGAWNINYRIGASNKIVVQIMSRFDLYWRIIIAAISAGLLVSSVCYIFLVLTGKTNYPKWMAALNPVCIFILLFLPVILLPAPIGGYIAPAYMNICVLAFFILALLKYSGKKAAKMGNNI